MDAVLPHALPAAEGLVHGGVVGEDEILVMRRRPHRLQRILHCIPLRGVIQPGLGRQLQLQLFIGQKNAAALGLQQFHGDAQALFGDLLLVCVRAQDLRQPV